MLKKGPVCPVEDDWIPFKDGQFLTSTGKAHLYIEEWAKKDFLPVVTWKQVKESVKRSPELAQPTR